MKKALLILALLFMPVSGAPQAGDVSPLMTIGFYWNENYQGGVVVQTIAGHTVGVQTVKDVKTAKRLVFEMAKASSVIYGRPLQKLKGGYHKSGLDGWGVFVPVHDGLWGL